MHFNLRLPTATHNFKCVKVTFSCRIRVKTSPWWHREALTRRPPFLNVLVQKEHMFTPAENGQVSIGTWNIRSNFMVSEFFGRRREWRSSVMPGIKTYSDVANLMLVLLQIIQFPDLVKWLKTAIDAISALIPTTLKYYCINHGYERGFSIRYHHKCLS